MLSFIIISVADIRIHLKNIYFSALLLNIDKTYDELYLHETRSLI
jgi:hypothetical protein